MAGALWPIPYLLLAPAILLVGLLVLGLVQIGDSSLRTLDTSTFLQSDYWTLANYRKALTESLFRTVATRSLIGALIVTAVTLMLAFPYAYLMVRTPSAVLRKVLLIALFLPFFIGQVVRAYGWLIILGNQGMVNEALGLVGVPPMRLLYNYPAVLFGLVQYMLPFAVLMLAPAMTAIPEELESAAQSLGANGSDLPPCRAAAGPPRPRRRGAGGADAVAHRFRHAGHPWRRLAGFHRQRHLRPVLPNLGSGPRLDACFAARRRRLAARRHRLHPVRRRHAGDGEGAPMTAPLSKTIFLWTVVICVLVILSAPTVVVLGASFTAGNIIAFPPEGLSLQWYSKIAGARDLWSAFLRSLYVATVCTIIAVPVGTLAGIALAKYRVRFEAPIQIYLLLPFTIPLIGSGIGLMLLFGEAPAWQLLARSVACTVINLPS